MGLYLKDSEGHRVKIAGAGNNGSSAKAYSTTLVTTQWVQEGQKYIYQYNNENIKCGKNGDVPPIISCTDNINEYSLIEDAEVTPSVGIKFTTAVKPTNGITITIIDM